MKSLLIKAAFRFSLSLLCLSSILADSIQNNFGLYYSSPQTYDLELGLFWAMEDLEYDLEWGLRAATDIGPGGIKISLGGGLHHNGGGENFVPQHISVNALYLRTFNNAINLGRNKDYFGLEIRGSHFFLSGKIGVAFDFHSASQYFIWAVGLGI